MDNNQEPFILKPNAVLERSLLETESLRNESLECLRDSTEGLTFEPERHRYFLGGREMHSVSSVVEYFAPFDSMDKAIRASKNPKHELFGKDPEEIVAIWEGRGAEAASAGTDIHAFGEACFLYLTGHPEEIEEQFKDRVTPDGLLAVEPKEVAAALWWSCQDWARYVPVAKENRVVNPSLGYAGTFDLLLYDRYNLGFLLKDYKTNKDLFRWFKEYLLPPLTMLKRNSIGEYTVQQTLYTIQLRNIGFRVIGNELIWLKEYQNQCVPLDMQYDKVVAYAAKLFKENKSNN